MMTKKREKSSLHCGGVRKQRVVDTLGVTNNKMKINEALHTF